MKLFKLIVITLCVMVALSACGGGGYDEGVVDVSSVPDVTTAAEVTAVPETTTTTDDNIIKLESGFYLIDLGQEGKSEWYVFDKDDNLVTDMWFDSVNVSTSWNYFERDDFRFACKVEDGKFVFSSFYTNVNKYLYRCEELPKIEDLVTIGPVPIIDSDLSKIDESVEYYLNAIETAVDFLVDLDRDFENTFKQIEGRYDNDSYLKEKIKADFDNPETSIVRIKEAIMNGYGIEQFKIILSVGFSERDWIMWYDVWVEEENGEWQVISVDIDVHERIPIENAD